MAVGVTSPEALRSPSLVACTSSPFHFRVLPGCAGSSEMSKRSEGPSAARVCERQQDVEAPVSDTVRGRFVSLRSSPRPQGVVLGPDASGCMQARVQLRGAGQGVLKSRGSAVRCLRRVRGVRCYRGRNRPRFGKPLGFPDWPILPKDRLPHWLDASQNCAAAFQLTAGIRRRIEIERRGLLSPHRLPGP